jgi:hypothetical protein
MLRLRSGLTGLLGGAGLIALIGACQHYGQAKLSQQSGAEAIPDKISYNWDVRPILAQNCFSCHGHDAGMRKASLRLDVAEAAYGKLPEDPRNRAIVRGNPGKSELIRRILSDDAEFRMPPKETHKVLSPTEIAILTKWVKQGAKYEEHWAYVAPQEATPAKTAFDDRAVNKVDRYVYAKLVRHDLTPAAEADRETLINRVSMDLTGLPPTLKDVDDFVADKDPGAYEKLVDRLLASPAYAERMATTWLDVARYADTDGYLNDQYGRLQHPYRDWVISAFQRNMPYDTFVTWQLAGDLLPNPTREQLLATAFARAGKKSNEGGIIDEEYRVEYVDERAELVGKAFLGLTVGCAKCHDHKYDAISQADYYSMGGFFNSLDERGIHSGAGRGTPMGPTLAWPTALQAKTLAAAHANTLAKQTAYAATVAAARRDAQVRANALSAQPGQIDATLRASMDKAQQAYYPLDEMYKASFAPLTIEAYGQAKDDDDAGKKGDKKGLKVLASEVKAGKPSKAGMPALAKDDKAAKNAQTANGGAGIGGYGGPSDPGRLHLAKDDLDAAIKKAVSEGRMINGSTPLPKGGAKLLLVGLSADKLAWTKSGIPGAASGAVNNGHVVDGPPGKGKAIEIDDTIGLVDKNVGKFERTQPFTLDLWVKLRPDKAYDKVNLLYNSDGNGAGYELNLSNNVLQFNLQHISPYNMISVAALKPLPKGQWVHVTATYDGSSTAAGAKLYVNGQPAQSEALHDHLTRTIMPRGGTSTFGSYFGLAFGRRPGLSEFSKGSLDEIRVFTKALEPIEVAYLNNPASVKAGAAIQQPLDAVLAQDDPRVIRAAGEMRDARLAEQKVETPIAQMMIMRDAPKPRKTYLLDRGNYDSYGKEVPVQALPQVFAWNAKLPRNRLGLTQWLFDPKNPLTARVYVNRLWEQHFGTGIVETVEDFGTQGTNPPNPELLDYLAVEFQRSGWDIRHIQKLIVMSATYRQNSNISREALEKDPRNQWLARGPRYRLPAEMIRDNALFASGLLVKKMGGDSVFPYQPDGVFDGAGVGLTVYPGSKDIPADQMHRRSLYTFIKRNALVPSLTVFDMADRNVSTVSRKISNTPLQALVLLNDPQYMEAYRKLAERALKTSNSPDQQIVYMFRLATRRHPRAAEVAELKLFRDAQIARLSKTSDEVNKMLAIGVAPVDPSVDRVQLAAMTLMTASVMNSPDAYSFR